MIGTCEWGIQLQKSVYQNPDILVLFRPPNAAKEDLEIVRDSSSSRPLFNAPRRDLRRAQNASHGSGEPCQGMVGIHHRRSTTPFPSYWPRRRAYSLQIQAESTVLWHTLVGSSPQTTYATLPDSSGHMSCLRSTRIRHILGQSYVKDEIS